MILPVQPEDRVDSVAPVVNPVLEFIKKHNIQLMEVNERPWGGFEVGFSKDGNQFIVFPDNPRGSRYSLEEAAVEVLKAVVDNPLLPTFLTQEELDELKGIV